jgi:hypothetical protein
LRTAKKNPGNPEAGGDKGGGGQPFIIIVIFSSTMIGYASNMAANAVPNLYLALFLDFTALYPLS